MNYDLNENNDTKKKLQQNKHIISTIQFRIGVAVVVVVATCDW